MVTTPKSSLNKLNQKLVAWQASYDSTVTTIKSNINSVWSKANQVEKTAKQASQIQQKRTKKLESKLEETKKEIAKLRKELENVKNSNQIAQVKKELLDSIKALKGKIVKSDINSKKRDLILDARVTGVTRRVNDIDKTFFEMAAKDDTTWKKDYNNYIKTQKQSLWDSVAAEIKDKVENSNKTFSLISIKK